MCIRDRGVELDIREFYQRMVDHPDVFPKTSMPSVDDYYQVFLPLAKQDVPMICICITTKFSGSMQSATTARDMILEEYPKARITVIDAEINTVLQGLSLIHISEPTRQAEISYAVFCLKKKKKKDKI